MAPAGFAVGSSEGNTASASDDGASRPQPTEGLESDQQEPTSDVQGAVYPLHDMSSSDNPTDTSVRRRRANTTAAPGRAPRRSGQRPSRLACRTDFKRWGLLTWLLNSQSLTIEDLPKEAISVGTICNHSLRKRTRGWTSTNLASISDCRRATFTAASRSSDSGSTVGYTSCNAVGQSSRRDLMSWQWRFSGRFSFRRLATPTSQD